MKQLMLFEDPKPAYTLSYTYDDLKYLAAMLKIKAPRNPKNYDWLRDLILKRMAPRAKAAEKHIKQNGFDDVFMWDYELFTFYYHEQDRARGDLRH